MTDSEIALMRRLISRDQSALSEIYHQYGRLVYSLALQILQNADFAEEVTQDVFLRVWNNAKQFNAERGRLTTWILVITRSLAIDRLRKEKRTNTDELRDDDSDDDGDVTWLERSHVFLLLRELPDDQRTLIEEAFLKGFTHSELAERFNLPLGTVKSRIRAGLAHLKRLWQANGESNSDEND